MDNCGSRKAFRDDAASVDLVADYHSPWNVAAAVVVISALLGNPSHCFNAIHEDMYIKTWHPHRMTTSEV